MKAEKLFIPDMDAPHSCCSPSEPEKKSFFRRPSFVWLLIALVLYGLSLVFPRLTPLNHVLLDYGKKMALPMAMGLLLGGLVDYYVPQEYISKYLTRRKKRTIFYATGLGFLMSACSHGILALSMELHKKGASGPAVISFLLASPWANLPMTFLLVGFFGTKGFLIIVLALAISFSTGLIFQVLDHKGWIEKNPHSAPVREDFSIVADLKKRARNFQFSGKDAKGILRGILELSDMVVVWIVIGILLASVVAAFVPADFFQKCFGPGFLGLMITLAVATVMEVCSEGTAPLAFEIYRQTGALGNAFAFLMGGVVTDYTEIGLVWKNLGKRTALWMVGVTLPQVIAAAVLLNLLK